MTPISVGRKRAVFIVDDHPLVREWLSHLINQQPDLMTCGEAATASEAIRAIAKWAPDVAVIDISLEDSSGMDLIKDLKLANPDILMLVLSIHDESIYAERALRAGAKGYIMKKETTKRIIEALRRVLEGKFYVSEAISETITTQFAGGKSQTLGSPLEQLSDRELVVFDLIGDGRGTRQIAVALHLSIKTVQSHCAHIKQKLNLRRPADLIREAIRYRQQT